MWDGEKVLYVPLKRSVYKTKQNNSQKHKKIVDRNQTDL